MPTESTTLALTEAEMIALPQHQRDVLAAREGKLRYKQIAETLNVPLGTVRSRINRGRAALEKLRAANTEATAQ